MKLSDFTDLLGDAAKADLSIAGVSADTRLLKKGDIFVALAGAKADGAAFIEAAAANGASAIIAANGTQFKHVGVPFIEVDDPHHTLAMIASRIHAPQPETVLAVTGTAGKTSVASFTQQILAHAGLSAGSIGTTGVDAPGVTIDGSLTTPDPVALHGVLQKLAHKGVTHVAMEASSHGLDQRRLDGVKLAAAGFTNLGRDHLDYHPTIEDYFAAKMRLFDTLLESGKPAVIFADDAFSKQTIEVCNKAKLDVCSVGRHGRYLSLKRVEHERHRQIAEIEQGGKIHRIALPLAGDFQIANALVSAGMALSVGIDAAAVFDALEHLEGAPGRLDLVGTKSNGALVYVDYAHKPEALEQVIHAVRPFTTGRVVVAFGCGGDRDPGKRAIMGDIAASNADIVYVTDDNPRSENPAAIRRQIMEASPGAIEIGDRREAIVTAIDALETGDTLVIAGKGHETGQTAKGVTVHFSDHEEALAALNSGGSAQ